MFNLSFSNVLATANTVFFTLRLAGLIVGIPLCAIGLGLIFSFRVVNQLKCRRLNNTTNCQFLASTLIGTKAVTVPLGKLHRAEIEQLANKGSEGEDNTLYRVVLHAEQNTIPWTNDYSSGKESKQELFEKITAFIQDSNQAKFQVKTVDWLWPTLGGILLFFGLVFIVAGVK